MKLYFTLKELNPHNYPLDKETQDNLEVLIERLSLIREAYGKPMKVTSGLRSPEDQKRINPKAPKSAHLLGMAVDISDKDKELKTWLKDNLDVLETVDLYCESFDVTTTWVHFQTRKPRSGKRVFNP